MRQKLEMASQLVPHILRNVADHKLGAIVFPVNSYRAWRLKGEYLKKFVENIHEGLTLLEKLRNYPVDAHYHNAANRDQYKVERFEKALQNEEIVDLELDVLSYEGKLVVGHADDSFRKYLAKNPNALVDQDLGRLIEACVEHGKGLHFDLKFSEDDKEAVDEFVERVEKIPLDIGVKISGREWDLQKIVYQRIRRPKITLFSVDEHLGNTWDNYKTEISERLTSDRGQIGVSIRDFLVTQEIIDELNEQGQYSLIYYIDLPEAALYFAEMGVSGITSNDEKIIKALYKPKEPHREVVLFSG